MSTRSTISHFTIYDKKIVTDFTLFLCVLLLRRPTTSTLCRSSSASDVYELQMCTRSTISPFTIYGKKMVTDFTLYHSVLCHPPTLSTSMCTLRSVLPPYDFTICTRPTISPFTIYGNKLLTDFTLYPVPYIHFLPPETLSHLVCFLLL